MILNRPSLRQSKRRLLKTLFPLCMRGKATLGCAVTVVGIRRALDVRQEE
jgi:hypothetical protein